MRGKENHTAEEKRYWIRITRRCNNRCLFCLDRDNLDGSIMSFDDIVRDLKKGLAEGARRAVISGGEPTIHPDFLQVIAKAKEVGYGWIQTVSNGRMFSYEEFLESAVQAGLNEITFSLHAHNSGIFEELTGAPGSFRQSFRGLRNALGKPGLVVSVDIVVTGLNVDHLEDIIKQFLKLGVREFDILNLIPFGNAWKNRDRLFFDVEEKLPLLKRAFDFASNTGVHLWTNRFPPMLLEGYEELIQMPKKYHDEVYGRREMFREYLDGGTKPVCEGEQCGYCSMKLFCKTMFDLRERLAPGKQVSYEVSKENIQFMGEIAPESVSRLFLETPELIGHSIVESLLDKGIPATVELSSIPWDAELEILRKFQLEIEINRETAPVLLEKPDWSIGLDDFYLSCSNRAEVDECRTKDVSLRGFFDQYGEQNQADAGIVNVPPCISLRGAYTPIDRIPPGIYSPNSGWNLESLTDFFIKYGYYSHSFRCRKCAFRHICRGLHVNYIRAFGFQEIRGPESMVQRGQPGQE